LTEKGKNGKKFSAMICEYDYLMKQAILEAKRSLDEGEVPVGAVLADAGGRILASAHNQPITLRDPTAHAEILALRAGGKCLHNYRLPDTILVVTIEPCAMCMGAILHARISKLVFGAFDTKAGAAGSIYNLPVDRRLNHSMEVVSGIMEEECVSLLKDFFDHRRREIRTRRRGTEVVVTGSTRNRLVPLRAGHVGSNPTLSAK
jgi:tRNA(adenine34) deaminase